MKKKKDDYVFYWEEPKKKSKNIRYEDNLQPFEVTITFPKISFPNFDTPANIIDNGRQIIVAVELPGFKKDEISVNITERFVEVSAKRKQEKINQDHNKYIHKSSTRSINQSFSLPAEVNPDKAFAKLENEILTVVISKSNSHQRKKKKLEVR